MEWQGNASKHIHWYSDWHFDESQFVRSSVKSAEVILNGQNNWSSIGTKVVRTRLYEKIRVESMDYDMSDVYKIPMLRIPKKPQAGWGDEPSK